MKGYKLKAEGPHHYDLVHPDGSTFKVAKAGLSMAMHAQMAKMPRHMDEGGEADGAIAGDSDPQPLASDVPPDYLSGDMMGGDSPAALQAKMVNAANPDAQVPVPTDAPPSIAQVPVEAKPAAPDQIQVKAAQNPNTTSPVQPTQTGSSTPSPYATAQKGFNKALGEASAGAKAQKDASTQYAKDAQAVQEDLARKQALAYQTYQSKLAEQDAENKRLAEDYANSKIDPGRVWAQASTGARIAAGIGVLLSGIGSGLTGQKNMAMEVINNTIQRDVDAQRADLGKKENLLSQNYRKYGDIRAAYAATQAQLLAVTQGQLAASAAKMGIGQADATYQQTMSGIDMKRAELQMQAAQWGIGVALGSGQGANQPINPEYLPPELQKRAIQTPTGGVVLARQGDDAKDVRNSLTTLQTIESRIDDALKFQAKTGRTVSGSSNDAVGKSIRDAMISSMGELNDLKRLNPEEMTMWKEMVPDPGAWRQDKTTAQLMQLKKLVQEKRNAEYANHTEGYNPGRSSSRDVPLTGGP